MTRNRHGQCNGPNPAVILEAPLRDSERPNLRGAAWIFRLRPQGSPLFSARCDGRFRFLPIAALFLLSPTVPFFASDARAENIVVATDPTADVCGNGQAVTGACSGPGAASGHSVTARNAVTVDGKNMDPSTTLAATLDTASTGATPGTLVKVDTDPDGTGTGNDVTFGDPITGALSGIDKRGAGTLTLTGTNTYGGGTTVSAGTLKITGTLGSGSYAGAIANAGTLVFDQAAPQTLSGVISGAGQLVKDGTGSLTLTRANDYTGLTEVKGGTLALSGSGKISNRLVLRQSEAGTTFDTGGSTFTLARLDVHGSVSYTGDLNVAPGGAINFYVPSSMPDTGTLLTVNGGVNIGGAKIKVNIEGQSSPLRINDGIMLIKVQGGSLSGKPANPPSPRTKLRQKR